MISDNKIVSFLIIHYSISKTVSQKCHNDNYNHTQYVQQSSQNVASVVPMHLLVSQQIYLYLFASCVQQ